MKVAVVGYVGDGVSDHSISHSLGVTPDVEIAFGLTSGGESGTYFKTGNMGSNDSGALQGGQQFGTDGLRAMSSTEFKVGDAWPINRGAAYSYIAVLIAFESDHTRGTFATDNTDNKDVTHGLSGTVEAAIVANNWNGAAAMGRMHTRARGASTDVASPFDAAVEAADYIQDLVISGTQIRLGLQHNTPGGNTCYWTAWKQLTDSFYTDSYSGNGTAGDRSITLTQSWTPDVVMIKSRAAKKFWIKTSGHSGDNSTGWNTAQATNAIKTLGAGSVTIDGGHADLNTSGETYDVIAFRTTPAGGGGGFRSRIAGGFVLN